MSYNDPNYTVRREEMGVAGGAATTEYAKFRVFQAARLKKVHAIVVTAGTVTGHGLDVYSGTTSIGTIALSTNTAGYVAHSALLDATVASMGQVSVKTLADATGVAHVIYEYHMTPDGVVS